MVNTRSDYRFVSPLGAVFFGLLLLLLSGCALRPPLFPPQTVMQNGNYEEFFAANEQVLNTCNGGKECEPALFNLGFLYAYSKSPYYDPQKAMEHFEQLTRDHSRSPLTFQAEAWLDLLQNKHSTEIDQLRLEQQLKSRDAAIKSRDAAIRSKSSDIKSRESTINDLQEQIQRSLEIDQEMDQRERELLH